MTWVSGRARVPRARAPRSGALPGLPILTLPRPLTAHLLAINVVAAVWSVAAVSRIGTQTHTWWVLGFLILLALAFEESASHAARLQLRLSADLKRDMTSVWAVAGAVALRPGAAVLLMVSVLVYVWFRQQRPAGQPLYRVWYTASSQVLGCLVAGLMLHTWMRNLTGLSWALAGALSVLLVILVQTGINRLLVTIALIGVGVRGRALLGSHDDNLIELATLCLGGLVALAILHQPLAVRARLGPDGLAAARRLGARTRDRRDDRLEDRPAQRGGLGARGQPRTGPRPALSPLRWPCSSSTSTASSCVNDRYGHLVGDAVLKSVGRCLSAEVREYDSVGRFGGEEFVAVLPSAGDADALVVAERLRARVNALRVSDLVDDDRAEGRRRDRRLDRRRVDAERRHRAERPAALGRLRAVPGQGRGSQPGHAGRPRHRPGLRPRRAGLSQLAPRTPRLRRGASAGACARR